MVKAIKKLLKKSIIKKKIDDYLGRRIQDVLKEKLDFNNTIEYKKIFEVGYYNLQWEMAIKRGDKIITKELENNIKIHCYTDSNLCRDIFSNNFENNELVFLKNYLKKGDVFIDIGANIGLYSIFASKYVGKEGYVIAYEPTPITYGRLIENIKLNTAPNLSSFQVAISDNDSPHEFTISKDGFDAWNSLAKPSQGELFEIVEVNCKSIDNIVKEERLFSQAKLIKIDVEGWELYVLKGGEVFFSKPDAPTILIEFADQNALNAGTACKELYEYLNYLGYTLYRFNSSTSELIFSEKKNSYQYDNLVAIKDISKVRMQLSDN